MKKIIVFLSYCIFAIMLCIYLIPKVHLYYLLEEEMLKKEIIFSNENIEEKYLSFTLRDFDVYYKKQYVLKVSNLEVSYNIAAPLELHINANGPFGTLYMNIGVINRKVIVALKASSSMKKTHNKILSKMKLIEGVYTYEFKY